MKKHSGSSLLWRAKCMSQMWQIMFVKDKGKDCQREIAIRDRKCVYAVFKKCLRAILPFVRWTKINKETIQYRWRFIPDEWRCFEARFRPLCLEIKQNTFFSEFRTTAGKKKRGLTKYWDEHLSSEFCCVFCAVVFVFSVREYSYFRQKKEVFDVMMTHLSRPFL